VFATSPTFHPSSGVNGADSLCNDDAQGRDLGSGFRAWLSTSAQDARDRIADPAYFLPSGPLVATSLADLKDGTIATPTTASPPT